MIQYILDLKKKVVKKIIFCINCFLTFLPQSNIECKSTKCIYNYNYIYNRIYNNKMLESAQLYRRICVNIEDELALKLKYR